MAGRNSTARTSSVPIGADSGKVTTRRSGATSPPSSPSRSPRPALAKPQPGQLAASGPAVAIGLESDRAAAPDRDRCEAHLRAILRQLPARPGVYLMKGADGRVLYVGKADLLRHRVRSYFGSKVGPRLADRADGQPRSRTSSTSSPTRSREAFLLESNLIKEHRPRFNIRLRDDKSYPFVKITLGEDFPRIVRTRKLARDGSRYFGPYASASSVDETLKLLRKIFPFRTCNLEIPEGKRVLERPCLLYYIKRCQGPCIQAIAKGEYRATIDRVVDFLDGQAGGDRRASSSARWPSDSEALRYEAGGGGARQAARRGADDRAAEDGGLLPRPRRTWWGSRAKRGRPASSSS